MFFFIGFVAHHNIYTPYIAVTLVYPHSLWQTILLSTTRCLGIELKWATEALFHLQCQPLHVYSQCFKFTVLTFQRISLQMQRTDIKMTSTHKSTYFVTYQRVPLQFNRSILFSTVTSWKFAFFSLRKKVSGSHISDQVPCPSLIVSYRGDGLL